MIRKFLLPILAILGVLFALFIVYWTTRSVPTPPILFPPPVSPYASSIAGSGIIETSSRNIAIGSSVTQIVSEVYVNEGDRVHAGDPLFKLDTRPLEAQLATANATLAQSQVTLESTKAQFNFYERLKNTSAVSEQAYTTAYYAMKEAEEAVRVAEGNCNTIQVNIGLGTTCSPIDAYILQVNVRPGMIVIAETQPVTPVNPFTIVQPPTVLLGSVEPLILRIDIDEDDAWRYKPGSAATAFVRGNSRIHFPLKFERIEPYVIPKISFTGDVGERIDTRVLQVLYSFEWGDLPVYVGQVLDIFIEAEQLK
jgi:HlyD family secretion protein